MTRALVFALGLLTAFGPLTMDLYLPGMPSLVADLGTTDAIGQLTMSACMIGLALGQLVLGPMSDRYGRRRPMLIGVAAFAVVSVMCAIAPTVELLIAARFAQGLTGAAGIVIGRAVVRDLSSGAEAARAFSALGAVMGIAPVIAPLLGGALLLWMDWRGLYVALAVIGALLLLLAWRMVPESLGQEHRHTGGVLAQLAGMARIAGNRRFLAMALALAFMSTGLFTYISMSSLVLQHDFGLSVQGYAILFAVNAVGIVIGTRLNARIVHRFGPLRLALVGVSIAAAASVVLALSAALGMPLPVLCVAMFFAVCLHGAGLANITAVALEPITVGTGAASAILGTLQFLLGAVIPPLVSAGGTSATLMGACMAAGLLVSLVLLTAGSRARPR